jgi:hypothetical protein
MSYLDNGKLILKNQEKYNYILVYRRKAILLSKSNSKKEARREAFNVLNTRCRDYSKLDNITILRLKIRKVTNKEKKEDRECTLLTLVGGVLVIIIQEFKIKINELKLKFIKECRDRVFVDKSFLKKNNYIDSNVLRRIGYAYLRRTYGHLFSIDTITSVLKTLK